MISCDKGITYKSAKEQLVDVIAELDRARKELEALRGKVKRLLNLITIEGHLTQIEYIEKHRLILVLYAAVEKSDDTQDET